METARISSVVLDGSKVDSKTHRRHDRSQGKHWRLLLLLLVRWCTRSRRSPLRHRRQASRDRRQRSNNHGLSRHRPRELRWLSRLPQRGRGLSPTGRRRRGSSATIRVVSGGPNDGKEGRGRGVGGRDGRGWKNGAGVGGGSDAIGDMKGLVVGEHAVNKRRQKVGSQERDEKRRRGEEDERVAMHRRLHLSDSDGLTLLRSSLDRSLDGSSPIGVCREEDPNELGSREEEASNDANSLGTFPTPSADHLISSSSA